MNRRKSTYGFAAVALLTAALLSACGSSDKDSDATDVSTAVPADAKSADPSLAPVKIGFHNLEGGQFSLTDMRKGFESAVDYVNRELGGVNGHPLEAVVCKTDVTPESSVNCANKFVSDDVVMAVQGVDFAGDAALPVLQQAGIVDVSAFAYGPAENVAVGDAFISMASNEEGYAAGLVQLKNMGAKSIAVVLADVPPNHTVMDEVVKPTGAELGIEIEPFFYPSPTDWTSFGATVLASKADAITFWGVDADCLAAVPAFRSLGFTGTIHAGSCAVLADKLDPSSLKDVIVANSLYNPTMDPIPAASKDDLDVYKRYSADDDVSNQNQSIQGFHTAMFAYSLLAQVKGEVTASSVKATAATATGDLFFREVGYDCATPTWPGTTACSGGFVFTEVNAAGKNEVLPDQPVDVASALD
ncbi:ABC transporter substrate-binding protein [Nocardioides sp. QY071]|uniref:ABC transporter substrate-binding protein n=1 Tax=Nocardioides sp. QY071 TaxID=3044187 RepID=UPI00249B7884|nr:ABC transporter substrate-binding protein [Nocardioides sp. QY071]WGY00385.1 ABC transporter substrate-binding protein [Nocardioides sp. QY071]